MKKKKKKLVDPDMLPEYDFTGGVRGKYYGKFTPDSTVTVIGKRGSRTKLIRSKQR